MNFLLTNYIFPIKKKIALSKHLKIYFDNPRTEDEVRLGSEYIRGGYDIETGFHASEADLQEFCRSSLSPRVNKMSTPKCLPKIMVI